MVRVWSEQGDFIFNISDMEEEEFLEKLEKDCFVLFCDIMDGEGIVKGEVGYSVMEDTLSYNEWLQLEGMVSG